MLTSPFLFPTSSTSFRPLIFPFRTSLSSSTTTRQHRRTIVTALQSSLRELPFTTRALSFDSKNYHTWAYRQWVLCHFFSSQTTPLPVAERVETASAEEDEKRRTEVWEGELEYTRKLLEKDVRNNSAWNHRFFVAFESGEGGGEKEEVVQREIR
jgi:protein farnesyltransferase/geranylgeranyltransferase type-1 subunit alpha